MFTTVCPGCEASLNAPDTLKGKKVKCKKCGEPFVARAASDDEDEPPRKTVKMKGVPPPTPKSRKDDDDDETDEAPSLHGKKSKRPSDDEDTEVMEAARDDDDDEPKPKKKKKGAGKGKSKKKEGSPAMLIILIAVGAIVVLGGGGAAAFFLFFNDDDKPTTPSGKGATTTETSKQGATAVAAGWVEIHDQAGRYRIKFPSAPQASSRKEQTPFGEIEVKLHIMGSQTELFVCEHVPLPAERAGLTDEQLLDALLDLAKAKEKGAQFSEPKAIQYQGFTGREFTGPAPGKKGTIVARAILAKDRVIVLGVGAENATLDSPRVKAFFESLKVE